MDCRTEGRLENLRELTANIVSMAESPRENVKIIPQGLKPFLQLQRERYVGAEATTPQKPGILVQAAKTRPARNCGLPRSL
jgi:hypothetical protein